MNKKYILFFLFGLLSITISAQSLAEAKALYEKGEYEEAKPTFKKIGGGGMIRHRLLCLGYFDFGSVGLFNLGFLSLFAAYA